MPKGSVVVRDFASAAPGFPAWQEHCIMRSVDSFLRPVIASSGFLIALTITAHAALPDPLVEFRFSEGAGLETANEGALGGSGALVQAQELPTFTNNVPTGAYAPA